MTYYMFLDDERDPPEDARDWVILRNSAAAIDYVLHHGQPEFISFDHDLGGDDTAMLFVRWLLHHLAEQDAERAFTFYVHSQNPVGRQNIISAIEGYDRYFQQNS